MPARVESKSEYSSRLNTWAITTISAQLSSIPVSSKTPFVTVTRSSLMVSENTPRIPSLGSTALSRPMDDDHSGWASIARVKIPDPAPILWDIVTCDLLRTCYSVAGTHSATFKGGGLLTALRMHEITSGWYEGRALFGNFQHRPWMIDVPNVLVVECAFAEPSEGLRMDSVCFRTCCCHRSTRYG